MNKLLLLALFGCAPKPVEIQSNVSPVSTAESIGEVVIPFRSSGSMCLDAMQANLLLANCGEILSQGDISQPSGAQLYCEELDPTNSNPWMSTKFLVMMTDFVDLTKIGNQMVCLDGMFAVFELDQE